MSQLVLCTKTQSLKLKELGFDWSTTNYFASNDFEYAFWLPPENINDFVKRPTVALALKFIREKYHAHLEIKYDYFTYDVHIHANGGETIVDLTSTLGDGTPYRFVNYEAAESAGLDQLIEIALNNTK